MSKILKTVVVLFVIVFQAHLSAAQSSTGHLQDQLVELEKTLVISDIDDTLKVTHVLNRLEAIQNGLNTDNAILGMSSFFQLMARVNPSLIFSYVSNAPKSLMDGNHKELLKKAKFPAGEVFLRGNLSDDEHKIREIRKLMEKHQPDRVIMFGDNAEQDPMIYAQAEKEFPTVSFEIYIHQMYSVKNSKEKGKVLQPGQFGYVTAVELGLVWFEMGRVPQPQLIEWMNLILPPIIQEPLNKSSGSLAFPNWKDCRDFVDPFSDRTTENQLLKKYIEKRNQRCSKAA